MISRSSRLKDDTSMGALYIIAFAFGVILLKFSPARIDLSHFLFGYVLGLSNVDLWLTFILCSLILLALTITQRQLFMVLFDPAVSRSLGIPVAGLDYLLIGLMVVAMISSLQSVGIVLSLGLLILPAATLYLLSDSFVTMVWGSAFLGAGGAVTGLMLSYWVDLPSGPAVVMVLGLAFLAAYLFGPKYGIVPRYFRPRHLHEESLQRWDHAPKED
jgi:ABC-type Mn2+/Zn2+ transport system permease subunit